MIFKEAISLIPLLPKPIEQRIGDLTIQIVAYK